MKLILEFSLRVPQSCFDLILGSAPKIAFLMSKYLFHHLDQQFNSVVATRGDGVDSYCGVNLECA